LVKVVRKEVNQLVGWLRVRVSNCFTSCFNQFEFIVKVVVRIELFNVNVIMEVFIVSVIMEVFNVNVKLREVLNVIMEVLFIVNDLLLML